MNCFRFEFNRLSWAEAIQLNQYFESREIFIFLSLSLTKRNTKKGNKLEPDDSQTRFVDAHGTPQLDSRSHEYMKNNTQ